ncbi:unnamed protein product [Phytomonas sp. Hart1]|nr:unnamed protein product [Phytomonas sp. Hart1]|eukprot:CCW67274.1 unnamed protein product [Phytomonas sp. isolate Hart1]
MHFHLIQCLSFSGIIGELTDGPRQRFVRHRKTLLLKLLRGLLRKVQGHALALQGEAILKSFHPLSHGLQDDHGLQAFLPSHAARRRHNQRLLHHPRDGKELLDGDARFGIDYVTKHGKHANKRIYIANSIV